MLVVPVILIHKLTPIHGCRKDYGIYHDLDQKGIKTLVCRHFAVTTLRYLASELSWAEEASQKIFKHDKNLRL